MSYKVPFIGRAHKYTESEIETVVEAMQDAVPLTQGKYKDIFETKFCEYSAAEYSFCVCNATAALEIAAQLCQFADGDEVIIPSHTFTSSAYPFIKNGATPVWADIDNRTHVVTAETLEKVVTPKTKAIVVVHLYGYAADMPSISEFAKKHDLLVIEDTAQAMGTYVDGKMAGTFGDFGVFSFHSHKNMTTLGEGGMLTVRDKKYADIIPMIRHNGHCGFDFERPNYWTPAMGNVDLPLLDGRPVQVNNYCLGEVECALGIKLLDRIDEMNAQKRKRAVKFIDELAEFDSLRFLREDSLRHNYHLLAASASGINRDKFMEIMSEEHGIQCVVQYYPLNRYDYYRKLGFSEANCPNADNFFDNMVSFPFHHCMSNEDFEYMLESTKITLRAL